MTAMNGGGGGGGGGGGRGGKNAEDGKDANGYCPHKDTPPAEGAAEPEEKTLLTSEQV